MSRPVRFRMALHELGGLFALYARFLRGRVDLLPSLHLRELERVEFPSYPFRARAEIDKALGNSVQEVAPLYADLGWEVYRARWRDRFVVIEILRHLSTPALQEAAWKSFKSGIGELEGAVEGKVAGAPVLEEYRRWIELHHDVSRKRNILHNLKDLPDWTLSEFPAPIPELQTEGLIAYEWKEGKPLESILRPGAEDLSASLQIFAEGLLEQALFLSLIPLDLRPAHLVVTNGKKLALRIVPACATVPPERSFELVQYTAASIARDRARAVHALSRIASQDGRRVSEEALWWQLSGLQPELKIRNVTPISVSDLENYWHALTRTGSPIPLFLQLYHRQLTIFGHYNGDLLPSQDLISESIWPVLARIVRFHVSQFFSSDRAREWMVGSGLLFFGVARQFAIALEQVRDNDLSLVVETPEDSAGERRSNLQTAAMVGAGLAVTVFLAALHIAFQGESAAANWAGAVVALVAAVFLFTWTSRIE